MRGVQREVLKRRVEIGSKLRGVVIENNVYRLLSFSPLSPPLANFIFLPRSFPRAPRQMIRFVAVSIRDF